MNAALREVASVLAPLLSGGAVGAAYALLERAL